MRILFVDMEFGEIYGSFYRDFVPVEIGGIVYTSETKSLKFMNRKFLYDGDVVLRKNLTDELGQTIGLSETVANTKRGEYQKAFNPSYRLSARKKKVVKKGAYYLFGQLRNYVHDAIGANAIKKIILFGGQEDLQMFNKAHLDISHLTVFDIQQPITQELQQKLSLDKLAKIISFYVKRNTIGSRHFRHTLPSQYRYFLKPHRAIGDACRIFLGYQEFQRFPGEFFEHATRHLQKIATKERERFIPLHMQIEKAFPNVANCDSKTEHFVVEPAFHPCYQNGTRSRHFAFRIQTRNFTLSSQELYNPILQQEHHVYPFKQYGYQGYYCEEIQNVKAIAARFGIAVYCASNQAAEEGASKDLETV